MKHFWLGAGLLSVFLILGILVSVFMKNTHMEISQTLEEAVQKAISGDLETGIRLGEKAKKSWEKCRQGTAAVADHSPMDEIDSLFAEMEIYAQAREAPHFAACCAQLSQLVKAMYDAHALTWWNFL